MVAAIAPSWSKACTWKSGSSALRSPKPVVPVRGVLCFVDVDWPLIGGPFTVQGVDVLWMRRRSAMLTERGRFDHEQIADPQWKRPETFPRQKDRSTK